MRLTRWSAAAVTAAAIAWSPAAMAAQDIDTRNVDSYVRGGAGIYGQTFTVGSPSTLLSYSLWIGADDPRFGGVGRYDFFSQLFAWDGVNVVGGPLYTSATFDSGCCDDFATSRFDFNVGSLPLISGSQYLAVVARTSFGGLMVGYVIGPNGFIDSYSGGEFVGGITVGGRPDPANARYSPLEFVPGNDLMFVADFAATAVPEPATAALFATGLGLLGLVGRRAQRT